MTSPLISIVTPSLNQGAYIAQAIESVRTQDYARVEHIVIDGGSTDSTPEVLQGYPLLRVVSEPDRGQAHALNKGFALATGDILGYLNADDALLPGALSRVAREIDPESGRQIVMGRCRFVDAHGKFTGVEHPSHFINHRRLLAIWKGHAIPQPAVFWTREVWQRCGPMDEHLPSPWLDYDLFCRFSREYSFSYIDQVLATYRLHPAAQTASRTEAERLEECVHLSRRYWGSPLQLQYWQLTASLAAFRVDRCGRQWLQEAAATWNQRRIVRAVTLGLAGTLLAPGTALRWALSPRRIPANADP